MATNTHYYYYNSVLAHAKIFSEIRIAFDVQLRLVSIVRWCSSGSGLCLWQWNCGNKYSIQRFSCAFAFAVVAVAGYAHSANSLIVTNRHPSNPIRLYVPRNNRMNGILRPRFMAVAATINSTLFWTLNHRLRIDKMLRKKERKKNGSVSFVEY